MYIQFLKQSVYSITNLIHCSQLTLCAIYLQQLWFPYLHVDTDCFWYEISGIQECCT